MLPAAIGRELGNFGIQHVKVRVIGSDTGPIVQRFLLVDEPVSDGREQDNQ